MNCDHDIILVHQQNHYSKLLFDLVTTEFDVSQIQKIFN